MSAIRIDTFGASPTHSKRFNFRNIATNDVNFTSSTSFNAVPVLSVGSGSQDQGQQGVPEHWLFPASSIAGIVLWFSVPMLIFSPAQMVVISSTSSTSSAMMGEPPQARRMLAQSLTVT